MKFLSAATCLLISAVPLESAANAEEITFPQFNKITCGSHWFKVTAHAPTETVAAYIKLSGDSMPTSLKIPAQILRKSDGLVFESTDTTGTQLEVTVDDAKLYGVFRASNGQNAYNLGPCVAAGPDIK